MTGAADLLERLAAAPWAELEESLGERGHGSLGRLFGTSASGAGFGGSPLAR